MFKRKEKDYLASIQRARRNRKYSQYKMPLLAGAAVLLVLLLVLAGVSFFRNDRKETGGEPETVSEQESEDREKAAEEEKIRSEKQAVVDSYENLGIIEVSGYLNLRESASTTADIIGKLQKDSACEILDDSIPGWYQVSSGTLTGYISSEFVLTGEKAREKAFDLVEKRAVITADSLNIRKEPGTDADVVGQALQNEKYLAESEEDGWIQIPGGYISADYAEVKYGLNEARKLDMRSMVLNLYDNIGISSVDSYLNVREEPGEDGKIIGKMTSKSAGDILETTEDGEWYKIRSGPVTGYVKAEYILTGNQAKDEALQVAELMAIVSTDRLNVRTEPGTDSKIWTQISNNERYDVLSQQDGWVEIELDSSNGFVSTDFVDVRYALPEAIKFSPLDENKSLRSRMVNYALQFVGNRYVWGGNDPHTGADCSGFVRYIYKNVAGISLPRVSREQAKQGRRIKSSEMRPGDLIFYTNSRGVINHVAMYIGNGQIVHAASRRSGIKISTWNYRNPHRIVNILGD